MMNLVRGRVILCVHIAKVSFHCSTPTITLHTASMEFPYTVDVVEQSKISPPPGSVLPTSLPLTFFDILFLNVHPVYTVFFYEFGQSKADFFNTLLPSLKRSLSLTLQHFFPFAGNLAWPENSPKPVILFADGDSVSFTVSESQYDFDQLSGNHPKDVNLFHPLIPQLFATSDVKKFPILALQVTLFPNKGICIGMHWVHAAADGKILFHFMNSWAHVYQSESSDDTSFMTSEPLLCYDRSSIKDPERKEWLGGITQDSFISKKHIFPVQDKVLATLVIRPGDVKRMKQWVLAQVENGNENEAPLYLSTFVVTCAYVWVCLVKARWGKTFVDATDDPMFEYFCFVTDFRARRKPPLPPLYFGNCLGYGIVKISVRDLVGEHGMMTAARLIGNAVQKGDDDYGDKVNSKEFWLAVERGLVLSVTGATKLGIYEADFGWGSPKKVEVSLTGVTHGAMSVCEFPNEAGAVEVGLARNKLEMEAFASIFFTNLPLPVSFL